MTNSIFHQGKKPIKKALLKRVIGHHALIVYHRPETRADGKPSYRRNMLCYVTSVYRDYIFVEYKDKKHKLYTKYIMEVEVRD